MSRLAELQRSFFSYIVGQGDDFVGHVSEQGKPGAAARADIYRSAYRLRLREAIDTDHEVLGAYLGDALFESMVQGYIDSYPSRYSTLRLYAEQLPQYLREHPPFADHPVLSELASFERMLLYAFDAASAERVSENALAELPAARWPFLRLRFHPSVQVFCAHWNSVEIWQALKAAQVPPEAMPQPQRHWLMWRNDERVTEFRQLDARELDCLRTAIGGGDFASLCEGLMQHHAQEAVSAQALEMLQGWLRQGLVRRLVPD